MESASSDVMHSREIDALSPALSQFGTFDTNALQHTQSQRIRSLPRASDYRRVNSENVSLFGRKLSSESSELDEKEDVQLLTSQSAVSSTLSRFKGPKTRRSCTDLIALVVFFLYWIGMIVLACYAFTRDSNRSFAKYIRNSVDFQGNTCDKDSYLYFPDLERNPDFGVCVDECPDEDGDTLRVDLPITNADSVAEARDSTETEEVEFETYATNTNAYICAPVDVSSEQLVETLFQDSIGRFVGSLSECWSILLISCGITLVTSFIYLLFLRICGCVVLGISMVGVQAILIYGSYRSLQASLDPYSAVLFFLVVVFMIQRLFMAGIFITHASRVLLQLKKLLLVPFLIFLMIIALYGWGIQVSLSIFGAGTTTSRIARIAASSPSTIHVVTESFQVNTKLRWLFLYHLLGMYWSIAFVLSIGDMITATAVSFWYFSEFDNVAARKKLNKWRDPVTYALRSTFSYHLGTLALTSAAVPFIRTSRSVYHNLAKRNDLDTNVAVSCFAKCCCCCVWCFDCCLKYFCKEAMYITAIQGSGYFRSAKLAFTLLTSNLLRFGSVDRIGHSSVFIGKLIVCSTTCLIAWFLSSQMYSPVLPLLAIASMSYSIATAFMTIYETTINVLLLCFTLDENLHGGRGKSVYAPRSLIRSIDSQLRPKWQTIL
ncbi:unnamed protein product [Albugo candida]|nr:unnamed protein product [Albugo candida]|eukprot:CCI46494.1 unnamed protein product [Albugo candida]